MCNTMCTRRAYTIRKCKNNNKVIFWLLDQQADSHNKVDQIHDRRIEKERREEVKDRERDRRSGGSRI